ncbi:hypothetical protein [Pseudoalteromonas sp. 1_2015MBL_MicDiv]|uniref:hypothetical protein n=1 Tax=Pseudoalteromonas sp. 1_2015MBL_MicDiv TaxID=1720343 RepID=UPI000BBE99F8|nr:hypothetical protein [Pseudoalteromonas sp. 1_2015MBL_MicDiv]ATG78148.1 hypothetical protein AOR04_11800 [Pseudoalteromonas sp. 1_2015MBL_MicDiv]
MTISTEHNTDKQLTEVENILAFLTDIDINHRYETLNEKTFLPGLKIEQGTLLLDLEKLLYPGDILHEAGHIAVTSETTRTCLTGDMKNHDHQAAEEMTAIAWSWAAACYLNIAPNILFHEQGYKGASDNLIEAFTNSTGFGYPLLYSWFMCEQPNHPNGYPNMLRWLRNDAYTQAQLK